jgi:gliding motility-associated-like protein
VVGTTVTFCYTLTNYAQTNADWIAGFAITLGPGWDASSLAPLTPPNSCDGQGTWDWYSSCTGTASGITWGPGFYYDTPAGSPNFSLDGIPGNNFGDNCQNNTWNFCFTVTVGPCATSSNAPLNIGIQALSDYQAGSWGNDACFDPPLTAPIQWPTGTPSAQCNCVLIVPNITINDVSCSGLSDGSVTVFPQGVAPYSYQWSNGATTQTISNLSPGIYTVTVTDSTQCTKTVTIPVSAPSAIALNGTVVDNVCDNASGSISLSPSGGTGQNYTYIWSNGSTSSSINSLPGGTYTVTVTDSNGCTQSGSFVINVGTPFPVVASNINASCFGTANGSASVSPAGVPPYAYLWSNGSTLQTVNNLSAGTYTCTITDSTFCTSTVSVTISEPPAIDLNEIVTGNVCDNVSGSIVLAPSGGTGQSFSFQWSDGSTGSSLTGLAPGSYSVTVTDSLGCNQSGTFTINSITPIAVSASNAQSICVGDSASISCTVNGGAAPFNYAWSNGSSGVSQIVFPTSSTTYTIIVTDANGCSAQSSVAINVTPYPSLQVNPPVDICYGLSTQLTATGASTYSWSPATGLSDPNSANPTASPNSTTNYIVTAANGNCVVTDSVLVTVAPEILVSFNPDVVIGYPPLTVNFANNSSGAINYSWSFGDGNTSNLPNGSNTYQDTGIYVVTLVATNGLGCSDSLSFSFIIVEGSSSLFIPNIFTPNGDQFNPTFHFEEEGISQISCTIFNRWGKEVYSWNKLEGSWDGKSVDGAEMPDGAYIYVVKATGVDGKSYDLSGFFQLVRGK